MYVYGRMEKSCGKKKLNRLFWHRYTTLQRFKTFKKKQQQQQQINKNKQNIKMQKKREKVLLLKNITYPFHRPNNDERFTI